MLSVPSSGRQTGLTLLEVLIAISIFALMGVAAFRVLNGVMASQAVAEQHSRELAKFQKALRAIDRDLQQVVERPVRRGGGRQLPALMVASGDYALELTRGGWQNPLQLPRSSLQRVAYDIGPHPKATERDSPFFGDEQRYLLRLFWTDLDRDGEQAPIVQPLLAGIEDFQVTVISDRGRHGRWPLPAGGTTPPAEAQALELSVTVPALGVFTRLYRVPLH